MNFRSFLLAVTSLWVCFATQASVAISQEHISRRQDDWAARVRALARPYMEKDIVGLSIGTFKNGETQTVHLGVAKNGLKPNDDTVYEIGSISKVFTGLMLGDAAASGLVSLDQTAQSLLPDDESMPVRGEPIRLVDLSTHASGLPRLPSNMLLTNILNPYKNYSSERAYAFLEKHELRRAPGEKAEYSNFAVSLLGKLIGDRQQLTYDELLRQKITDPLNMQSTAVELTPSMNDRSATPYINKILPGFAWDFSDMPGAGGIRSTTRDMIKFAKANLVPRGSLQLGMELAWQEHSNVDDQKMGLGWFFSGDGETRWHNGQTGGFHSMLMVNRQQNLAVVLLANTATMEVDKLAGEILELLKERDVPVPEPTLIALTFPESPCGPRYVTNHCPSISRSNRCYRQPRSRFRRIFRLKRR